jgi:hypothetical protein
MALSPYYEFFGHAIDNDVELALLGEFSTQIEALLRDAADRVPESKLELPDALAVIADDRGYLYSHVFPGVLHESFLITCVVFLERELRAVVDILKKVTSTSLSFSDLSGSNVERFRTFCAKVCGFNPGLSNEQWQSLTGLIEVRNCLIHSSGVLEGFPKRPAVEAFCLRHPVFTLEDGRLALSLDTSQHALAILSDFVETVYRAAIEKYPREA